MNPKQYIQTVFAILAVVIVLGCFSFGIYLIGHGLLHHHDTTEQMEFSIVHFGSFTGNAHEAGMYFGAFFVMLAMGVTYLITKGYMRGLGRIETDSIEAINSDDALWRETMYNSAKPQAIGIEIARRIKQNRKKEKL